MLPALSNPACPSSAIRSPLRASPISLRPPYRPALICSMRPPMIRPEAISRGCTPVAESRCSPSVPMAFSEPSPDRRKLSSESRPMLSEMTSIKPSVASASMGLDVRKLLRNSRLLDQLPALPRLLRRCSTARRTFGFCRAARNPATSPPAIMASMSGVMPCGAVMSYNRASFAAAELREMTASEFCRAYSMLVASSGPSTRFSVGMSRKPGSPVFILLMLAALLL